MNKYLKGCLVFVVVILTLVTGIIAWYYHWKADNQRLAQADLVKLSKSCDTLTLITEKPTVTLQNFDKAEIDRLRYYLIRKGKLAQDTTVRYSNNASGNDLYAEIPFDRFLKTDTIVVETNGKRKKFYQLSGFHHYAYLRYGMMGYLGSHDCRFDDQNFLVNGKRNNGQLFKQSGLNSLSVPKW